MGTNYYWHVDTCKTCGHSKGKYHIGKSSGGWTFSFQALSDFDSPDKKPIRSVKDWKRAMRSTDGEIVDEYGQKMSTKEFWEMVRRKKKQPGARVHATYVHNERSYFAAYCWLDDEGNSFSEGHFS